MSRKLVACYVGESLDTVTRLMRDRHCRKIPIVDDAGRPVGLLDLAALRSEPVPEHTTPPAATLRFSNLAFTWLLAEASIADVSDHRHG